MMTLTIRCLLKTKILQCTRIDTLNACDEINIRLTNLSTWFNKSSAEVFWIATNKVRIAMMIANIRNAKKKNKRKKRRKRRRRKKKKKKKRQKKKKKKLYLRK
ncbi:hypothetical protein M8J77_013894 [Diaphorina citri]|nr:hypothetical protein M8J77_013894 [Diaphorina citri]